MMVSSRDGSYSFHDLNSFVKLNQFFEEEAITQTQIHPDGLIMAIGLQSGKVKILDIRDMKVAFALDSPQDGCAVTSMAFSNKGVYLAVTWQNYSQCRVYSLHKECEYTSLDVKTAPSSIQFD